ncbi:MAG: hypothetical protein NWT08_00670 [Akkermansiaceae bacterium]|jgi:hypothetical protein|nr:hypothetical protein [Akkermansiaceae bacterium]MDP4720806.1 hypothetical protein [Akkermansiaceae bacterium]MDP4780618.1 hypothetical protein [Akkermansiaceae bacterium]MDP4848501.1 hypothetical protein [Akkermansiaceae bacterium]MDP4898271.1 hypothetical protein [Akkermansiaceae bacterium]
MKKKNTTVESFCDENIIVDFHEMISLLIGTNAQAQQEFLNDVLKRATEIRMSLRNGNNSDIASSKLIHFPAFPRSA